jgi:hypothetical protein
MTSINIRVLQNIENFIIEDPRLAEKGDKSLTINGALYIYSDGFSRY